MDDFRTLHLSVNRCACSNSIKPWRIAWDHNGKTLIQMPSVMSVEAVKSRDEQIPQGRKINSCSTSKIGLESPESAHLHDLRLNDLTYRAPQWCERHAEQQLNSTGSDALMWPVVVIQIQRLMERHAWRFPKCHGMRQHDATNNRDLSKDDWSSEITRNRRLRPQHPVQSPRAVALSRCQIVRGWMTAATNELWLPVH